MMQMHRIQAILTAATLALAAISVDTRAENSTAASQPEHKLELAKDYYVECRNADEAAFERIRPYLKAFTDVEVMADSMSDPVKFMTLMSVVNDPHTIHVMSKCATEPVMWDTWIKGLTDFNKIGRTVARFMNPAMYMAWMTAPMNPTTFKPMMQMMNPTYYGKWMTALMNQGFYQPALSMADPNWHTKRIDWMTNPQSLQPLFAMMNMAAPKAEQPANGQ